jgi:hypothetical protein
MAKLVYKRLLGEPDEPYTLFLEVANALDNGAKSIVDALGAIAQVHNFSSIPNDWLDWQTRYFWGIRSHNIRKANESFQHRTDVIRHEYVTQGSTIDGNREKLQELVSTITDKLTDHLLYGSDCIDRSIISILPSLHKILLSMDTKKVEVLVAHRSDIIQLELWN